MRHGLIAVLVLVWAGAAQAVPLGLLAYIRGQGGGGESAIPTNGLVAYWPFDGDALDYSGSAYTGTVYGATLTAGVKGVADTAYSFDGNDYISFGDILDDVMAGTNATFSISVWCKATANGWVFTKYGRAAANNRGIQWYATGQAYLVKYDNYNVRLFARPNPLYPINDTWVHRVLVYDIAQAAYTNQLKLYRDGSEITDLGWDNVGTFNQLYNRAPAFVVGRKDDSAAYGYLTGAVDEFRFYNRVLTPAEISAIYNAEKP